MDKPIEFAFTLGIALLAPILQTVVEVQPSSVFLALAVLSGALTYFTRAVILDKINTKVAVFSALTAVPFGVFVAPMPCHYFKITESEYLLGVHYLFGLVGVLAMNTIWSIMAGIHKDAYPAFKVWAKSWIPKKNNN